MKRLALVLAAALAVAAPAGAALNPNPKVAATQAALRDLWVDHVFLVRNVALAKVGGDEASAKVAEERVVANAKQIAGAVEPFYGKAAADALFGLLAGHYGAVKAHLEATVAGDAKAGDAAVSKAMTNAHEIATFLSRANPHLPKDTLLGLLQAHGGHHVQQNMQLKQKKYAEEARTWEHMRAHMYVIADALGDALAKQFPEKF
jgi:hypothetical protein